MNKMKETLQAPREFIAQIASATQKTEWDQPLIHLCLQDSLESSMSKNGHLSLFLKYKLQFS